MEADPVPEPDEYEPELAGDDDSAVDEGIESSDTDDGRTLPEDEPGVGVDVPQQMLGKESDESLFGDGSESDKNLFGNVSESDEGLFGDGPKSDEEMPLADHIEEMMRRLAVVFGVAGLVAVTLLGLGEAFEWLPTAVELIDILWNNGIPGAPEMAERRPRLYGPLELILTKLKVTGLAGLLIGLPVFVYETYLFMRPGLYRNERRYYLAAVPTSLILGTVGMAFAHYVIIPAIMEYFTVYTEENVSVAYGLAETFNLILVLMAYMAVVFQIPLFIMLAIMMGLVTRVWLEDKRLLFWGGFLTVAFLINPDPTGMTPFIIAATMIVLYEGTLALLRWTGN
jgi:sec-independent protein translocase protein TatC